MTLQRTLRGFILFFAGFISGSLVLYLLNYEGIRNVNENVLQSRLVYKCDEEKFIDYKRKFATKTLDAMLTGRKRNNDQYFKAFLEKQVTNSLGKDVKQATEELMTTQPPSSAPKAVEGHLSIPGHLDNLNRPKFILSFFFREQLTGAIKHFIYFAGVAKAMGRKAVIPFAAHSYIIGTPGSINQRENIGAYFDLTAMNETLTRNNYAPLASYEEFNKDCKNELEILIFFIYRQSSAYTWMVEQIPEMEHESLEKILAKTEKTGYTDCTWMQPLWMKSQKSYGDALLAKKIVCVDEQMITSSKDLETIINKDGVQHCVGVYRWTGVTYPTMKLQFNLDHIKSEVTHYDFPVSASIRLQAENFIKKNLPGKFLAVHARLEYYTMVQKFLRNFTWSNVRQTDEYKFVVSSLKNTSALYRDLKKKYSITTTFLATDLSMYGSTAMLATIRNQEHLDILNELKKLVLEVFENPIVYTFTDQSTDRGKVALVESEILSRGAALLIIGGGKFQNEFGVEKFLRTHNRNLDLIYHGYLDTFWYNTIIGALEKERKAKTS